MIASAALPGSLMVFDRPTFVVPLLRAHVAVPGVACGHDDHYATPDEPIDFDAERALPAGEHLSVEVVADAQVHAMNAQQLRVVVHTLPDVDERPHDVAHTAFTRLVDDLQAHEQAFWSDAVQRRQGLERRDASATWPRIRDRLPGRPRRPARTRRTATSLAAASLVGVAATPPSFAARFGSGA